MVYSLCILCLHAKIVFCIYYEGNNYLIFTIDQVSKKMVKLNSKHLSWENYSVAMFYFVHWKYFIIVRIQRNKVHCDIYRLVKFTINLKLKFQLTIARAIFLIFYEKFMTHSILK